MTYWVEFAKPVKHGGRDRQNLSVDGTEKSVRAQVAEAFPGAEIVSIKPLPYPAEPRLNYKSGACPSFCLQPVRCAGRTSCPRNISCSE